MSSAQRGAVVVVVGWIGASVLGCVAEGPEGTTGAKGKVVFQAETELVFSSRIAVGSSFRVTTVPKGDDVALSKAAELRSADDAIAEVRAVDGEDGELLFDVEVTGPGRVELFVVDDGADVDNIFIEAARAADTTLIDAALLSSSDVVDPRLPGRFAVIDDAPTRFLISAIDKCGGPLIDLGASTLVVSGEDGVDPLTLATVTADGAAAFVVEPALVAGGSFTVELVTPDIATLAYDVDVVARGDVDEVHAEVASVDTQAATARIWGRAFVDDVDVVGLDYDWSVDPRVLLDAASGPAVTASITFEADEAGLDLRPAEVTAEVFGASGTTDLLVLQSGDLVVTRGEVPVRPVSDDDDEEEEEDVDDGGGASCAGAESACNALAVCGAWVLRRRRRRPAAARSALETAP